MFLADPYRGHAGSHRGTGAGHNPSLAKDVAAFEAQVAAALRSFPSFPASGVALPIPFLARLADLLSETLLAAAYTLSSCYGSSSDLAVLSSYLDTGVTVLDACNAVSARIEAINCCRLHLRLALHLLSHPELPSYLSRARAALSGWDIASSHLLAVPFPAAPRGKISCVARVIFAVEAVSALISTAISSLIGGENRPTGLPLVQIGAYGPEFPWAAEFDKLVDNVSCRTGRGIADEFQKVDAAVKKLTSTLVIVSDDGQITENVNRAADELHTAAEDLTIGMEQLGKAVDGVFRAGWRLRDAALRCFRDGPLKCK